MTENLDGIKKGCVLELNPNLSEDLFVVTEFRNHEYSIGVCKIGNRFSTTSFFISKDEVKSVVMTPNEYLEMLDEKESV